jgi:hypothetical protein
MSSALLLSEKTKTNLRHFGFFLNLKLIDEYRDWHPQQHHHHQQQQQQQQQQHIL